MTLPLLHNRNRRQLNNLTGRAQVISPPGTQLLARALAIKEVSSWLEKGNHTRSFTMWKGLNSNWMLNMQKANINLKQVKRAGSSYRT